jgi:hypothetical protein
MREHDLLNKDHAQRLRRAICSIREILVSGDYCQLLSVIRGLSQARLLPQLYNRMSFLDIETTGLDSDAVITVATVLDWRGLRVFIRGYDLHELPLWLEDSHIVVTYGGSTFDIPFISREFEVTLPQLQIDLSYWYLRRSLKDVEKQYGIKRRFSTGIFGVYAIALWDVYCSGNIEALHKLVQYNIEDVLALEQILYREYHLGMKSYPLSYPVFSLQQHTKVIVFHPDITFTL